jgi:salicylate hydroxylase
MQESPETKALLRHSPAFVLHMAPGRVSVCSPPSRHGLFDLQLIDFEYVQSTDSNPELIPGRITDISHIRHRWRDAEPGILKVIEQAKSVWKWRLREVRGLPSWTRKKARFLLIGDGSHGIVPHAGQGASTAVGDGVVIGELLAYASPQDDVRALVQLFEKIRRPRRDLTRIFATIQGQSWSNKDPETI